MMKKAISLILAASVLCFATSALATPAVSSVTGGHVTTSVYTGNAYTRAQDMPGFRAGETISFTATGLTNGKELTVISYRYNDTLSDSTVQYINQYTITGNQLVSFKIRDKASGVYCVKLVDSNDGNAYTFYYKVGKVTATMVPYGANAAGTPYTMVDYHDGTYSIGFIAKLKIDSADVDLVDIGVSSVGFQFIDENASPEINGKSSPTLAASGLDTYFATLQSDNSAIELNGSYSVLYGATLWKVPATRKDNIKATAVVNY